MSMLVRDLFRELISKLSLTDEKSILVNSIELIDSTSVVKK